MVAAAELEVVGGEVDVPCLDGTTRRHVNLDYAASTPALRAVREAVEAFLPWYSSVHRGTGFKSRVSTDAYEGAREAVAAFVDAPDDRVVVFVRNTTEAVNVLAAALPPGSRVLASPAEHHANMLPWRRAHDVELLPFTRTADELVAATERFLARRRFDLLAITGASNVTGEVWPAARLAELAHRHGAEVFVDAAQLAPHRRVSLRELDVDHVALSGHKLYAPYGAGALVARADSIRDGVPLLQGGGAVKVVTADDVGWADLPDRYEAGSPNVVGAVALGAACDALGAFGVDRLAAAEAALTRRLRDGLAAIPGVRLLSLWPAHEDRVGVATFCVDGLDRSLVATALAAEWGIAVRSGSFCAHPLVAHLLGIDAATARGFLEHARAGRPDRMPGAVRASIGLGVGRDDVELLIEAVAELAASGPRGRYVFDEPARAWAACGDERPLPALPIRLASAPPPSGGCY